MSTTSKRESAEEASNLHRLLQPFFDSRRASIMRDLENANLMDACTNPGSLIALKAALMALTGLENQLRQYSQDYDLSVLREKM